MYMASSGSSPRRTWTGKVFVSFTPKARPRAAAFSRSLPSIGTASAYWRSDSNCSRPKLMSVKPRSSSALRAYS